MNNQEVPEAKDKAATHVDEDMDNDILDLSDPVEAELRDEAVLLETAQPEPEAPLNPEMSGKKENKSCPKMVSAKSPTKLAWKSRWNLGPIRNDFAASSGRPAPWTTPVPWTAELASALPNTGDSMTSEEQQDAVGPGSNINEVWEKAFERITTLQKHNQRRIWSNYNKLVASAAYVPFKPLIKVEVPDPGSGEDVVAMDCSGNEKDLGASSGRTSTRASSKSSKGESESVKRSSSVKKSSSSKKSSSVKKSSSNKSASGRKSSSGKDSSSVKRSSSKGPSSSSKPSSKVEEKSSKSLVRTESSASGKPYRIPKIKVDSSQARKGNAPSKASSTVSRSDRETKKSAEKKATSVRKDKHREPEVAPRKSKFNNNGPLRNRSLPNRPKKDCPAEKAAPKKKKESRSAVSVSRAASAARAQKSPAKEPKESEKKNRVSVYDRLGPSPSWFAKELRLPLYGRVPQDELMRMNGRELTGTLRTRRRRQTKTRQILRELGVAADELYYRYEWGSRGSRKRAASGPQGESGRNKRGCVDDEEEENSDDPEDAMQVDA